MDAQLMEHFGRGLRAARQKAGLSQAQLAAKAKTVQGIVSRVEFGRNSHDPDLFVRLARAVGSTAVSLLAEGEKLPKIEPTEPGSRQRKARVRADGSVVTPDANGVVKKREPYARSAAEPLRVANSDTTFRPGSEEYRTLCRLVSGEIGVDAAAVSLRKMVAEMVTG